MGGRHERRYLLSVLLQLPHPNGFGDCSSSALQGSKVADWVYFARSYFRTPEKTKLKKSTNLQQMKHGRHLDAFSHPVSYCVYKERLRQTRKKSKTLH